MSAQWIVARYRGKCQCGAGIQRGAVIQYDRGRKAVTACARCDPRQAAQGPTDRATDPAGYDASDMAYEDQCAAACGLTGMDS
jgi:hypothetical protein